jgi:hypothetical protein
VAELRRVSPAVVAVHARPALLDAVSPGDAIVHRVAADEAMVTGGAGSADALVTTLEGAVADDEGAVVLDVSDGWAAWAIAGADARLAFSRVSPLPLPQTGTVQGDVLRLPARVAASADELVVFVPAAFGAWVERKLRERCPELTESRS